ncbi:MAG TPA: glycosyl hydrolase [Bacteroidota bacterium]|nr:glycosyl hydrolase [Bacteroidota bacterium]
MKRAGITLLSLLFSFQITLSGPQAESEEGKQSASAGGVTSETISGLHLRSIGPAINSGRISSIAVDPTDHSTWYIAAASGGVWKTTNCGTTWNPVFDGEGSYSIGTVAVDPVNPSVVWVGTGENNSQRSVSYGDGVYRSEDGGKSWKNVGLKKSEHIARILIDPRNTNVVYVAAQGPLWGPGGDRGLYKTTDGGKTWKAILAVSENTGVTDVVMVPGNPDVLIAASYQRRRHVWTLIDGGPESAIYKSTDAGASWTKVTSGLRGVDMGRIGLAVSPADPRVAYAIIEASDRKGGIFRSTDYGSSWEKRNDFDATAMYYATLYADPKNIDRIYVMNTILMVSNDGGKTVQPIGEQSKHVDNHCMWIDPSNTNHYLVGCDGGLYQSFDRAQTWEFKNNLPITQFYDVDVDNASPFYNIYGGTQDNFSVGGPSRTRSESGIVNADWFVTTGGDGFHSRIDPEDPNTVYAESQYGGLVRFDKRTGEQIGIQPQQGENEEPLRWNWDSPLIISPHSHTRLYFAANHLYRSDDRGDTWKEVSPDLTRQIDRNQLQVMGRIWEVDAVSKSASTSLYGNCTALSESPLKEGLLYVGTDDGLVHVTEDGGTTWRKIDKFPGVPERTYVSRLFASQHDANTVYASFDNHKNADFLPYILKSADAGRTWTSVAGDLPKNGPVLALAEDHVDPALLFVGTEFGLFTTLDGGGKWVQLKSGLPTIAVRDLRIQKRENDLVLATFGRGFYVLDDYSPLRLLSKKSENAEAEIYPVKDALLYIPTLPLGGGKKSFAGESFFSAPNPPYGVTFSYYLKDALKTKKEVRQEAEKEARKKKIVPPYPTDEQLRAEDEEEAPQIILTISDTSGNVLRNIQGANQKGINRVSWNMRYANPVVSAHTPDTDDETDGGPLVMPGRYLVRLSKWVDGVTSPVSGPVPFTIDVDGLSSMKPEDRKELSDFQQRVFRLQRSVAGTVQVANELKARIGTMMQALLQTPANVDALIGRARTIEATDNEILRKLRGDNSLRSRNEASSIAISERVSNIVEDERFSTSRPTQTHRDAYTIASGEFSSLLKQLNTLVVSDVATLQKDMEAAGAPWTPGRIPEWNPDQR